MLKNRPTEVGKSWPHSPSDVERHFGLWPVLAGGSQTKPDYNVGPRVRPHYSLHLVLGGRAVFRSDQMPADAELATGDLFCIFPDVVTQQRAVRSEPPRLSWLAFDGPAAPAMAAELGLTHESPILRGLDLTHILPHLRQMGTAFSDTPSGHPLRSLHYLVGLLGELIAAAPPVAPTPAESWLRAGRALIDEHSVENISVAEVAAQVGVDRSHFSKAFAREFGMSPSTYLQQARLAQANRLLTETTLSISQVALSVGYADVYSFSHAFRRRTGRSPSDARRVHGRPEPPSPTVK